MVNSLEDLIRTRQNEILKNNTINEYIRKKSKENSVVLADAIIKEIIEYAKISLDKEILIIRLHCVELTKCKSVLYRFFHELEIDENYLKNIDKISDLYTGFDTSSIGLDNIYYVYLEDLKEELKIRGLNIRYNFLNINNKLVEIEASPIPTLSNKVEHEAIESDKKTIIDIINSRKEELKKYNKTKNTLTNIITSHVQKEEQLSLELIMNSLLKLAINEITQEEIKTDLKVIDVPTNELAKFLQLLPLELELKDNSVMSDILEQIKKEQDLYYVTKDSNRLLVNFYELLRLIEEKNLKQEKIDADTLEVSAILPTRKLQK